VPRIGITGHMNLTPETVTLVRQDIEKALAAYRPDQLIGVSCLAVGADSIFAEAVLNAGGTLEVILPAEDYRERKVKPDHAPLFDNLISRAAAIHVMPYATSNRDAYEAANNAMLDTIDQLFAVWDGKSPVDKGGTAAVVEAAKSRNIAVRVIWPDGATRN
jgi:hypothetical protein